MISKGDLDPINEKINEIDEKIIKLSIDTATQINVSADRYETQNKILDKIDNKLCNQDIQLNNYNELLKDHIRRTNLLESNAQKMDKKFWILVFVTIIIGVEKLPIDSVKAILLSLVKTFI